MSGRLLHVDQVLGRDKFFMVRCRDRGFLVSRHGSQALSGFYVVT